jgi:5'(3')-deoxyribonucleotidase
VDQLSIAIDLDDVTLEFTKGNIDAMYREFGLFIPGETWDFHTALPWTEYGYKDWWHWLRERDWLWATFPAVPGAVGGVHALRSKGHWVECLTSKPEWAEPMVWRWLGRWRVPFNQVTIVDLENPKHSVSQADILVDDKLSNIQGWVDSAEDRLGILFDQPWNRDVDLGERTVRAFDWQGVMDTVALMEEVEA